MRIMQKEEYFNSVSQVFSCGLNSIFSCSHVPKPNCSFADVFIKTARYSTSCQQLLIYVLKPVCLHYRSRVHQLLGIP